MPVTSKTIPSKISLAGPILANLFVKTGPARPILAAKAAPGLAGPILAKIFFQNWSSQTNFGSQNRSAIKM